MMTREWKSKTLKARNWQRGKIERERVRERGQAAVIGSHSLLEKAAGFNRLCW